MHAVHAAEVEVELVHPSEAVHLAGAVPIGDIDSAERCSRYWILSARAAQMNAQPDTALRALLEAEQAAGPRVLNRPMTHDLISGLLHTTRSASDQLRRLADLIGA